MKFNKKSLVKVAILSAILGLNGMCFGNVVNGAEVAVEEAVVRNGKCKECGTDNPMFNFTTGDSLCRPCLSIKYRKNMKAAEAGKIAWELSDEFIKKYRLTGADRIIMNQAFRKKDKEQPGVPGYLVAEDGFPQVKCDKCGGNVLFVSKAKRIPLCYDCITENETYREVSVEAPGAVDLMLNEKFIKEYELTEEDRQNINDAMEEMYEKIHAPGFRIAKDGFPEVRVENKNPDEEVCSICYDNSGELLQLPCCGNKMCRGCIVKWASAGGNTCPTCRSSGDRVKRDAANGAVTINRKLAWDAVVKLSKKFESQKNDDEFKKELEKLEGKVIKLTQEKKEEQERISHEKWYMQQKDEATLNGLKDENIQAAVSQLDKYTELEQRYSNEMDTVKSLDVDREDWTNIEKNWDKYVEAYQSANNHHDQLKNML
jgi:hypothetical protein